jgi:nitronate monooxygenase
LHAAAKARGEFGYGAQWAGQGAPLARVMATGDLVKELAAQIG